MEDNLEQQADELLKAAGKDKEYPSYPQDYLLRKRDVKDAERWSDQVW